VAQLDQIALEKSRNLLLCAGDGRNINQFKREFVHIDLHSHAVGTHAATSLAPSGEAVDTNSFSSKQTRCNRVMASDACSSSTINVRLILDEPNEIIEMLMSLKAANNRAAIPDVLRRPSPMMQMIVRLPSTSTLPNCSSSGSKSGSDLVSSTDSET